MRIIKLLFWPLALIGLAVIYPVSLLWMSGRDSWEHAKQGMGFACCVNAGLNVLLILSLFFTK